MKRRVVITGIGIISSIGTDTKTFWQSCLDGKTNIQAIPQSWNNYSGFNSGIWSPLPDINFEQFGINRIEQKKLDKAAMLALSASFQAVKNSGLKTINTDNKNNSCSICGIDNNRTGIFIGTGIGGVSTLGECFANQIMNRLHDELKSLIDESEKEASYYSDKLKKIHAKMTFPKRFNPFAVSMIMSNACAANIAIKYGINGINNTFTSACASGTVAIGNAFNAIRNGALDYALTGGTEYFYDDYGALFYSFDILKTLAHKYDDIETANRPFDRDRSGFLYSQGGSAILMIEELSHAVKRGADILAEIRGFAETCDAHNIMVIDENSGNIKRMINAALKDASIEPGRIDYINSHGTGTELNDEIESKIIGETFVNKPAINSTKSILGHTLGASGAFEAAVCALSIKDKKIHISKNIFNPVRELNFAYKTTETDVKNVLSQSFGFGGHNAALVISEYSE